MQAICFYKNQIACIFYSRVVSEINSANTEVTSFSPCHADCHFFTSIVWGGNRLARNVLLQWLRLITTWHPNSRTLFGLIFLTFRFPFSKESIPIPPKFARRSRTWPWKSKDFHFLELHLEIPFGVKIASLWGLDPCLRIAGSFFLRSRVLAGRFFSQSYCDKNSAP